MASHIERRKFLATLGGAAAAWPFAARAQQRERMRRIGVLLNLPSDDPEGMARLAAFLQGLQELGWVVGRNVRIDYRWGTGDADRIRGYAAELVALAPDVILSSGTPSVAALQQATRTVPIVFAQVADPVGAGYVESLARPGRNITGFAAQEYVLGAKWLELLKEIAPHVKRAAVLRDSALGLGAGQLAAIQAMAPPLGLEVTPIGVSDIGDIERGITAFARSSNGGMIVTASTPAMIHRELITMLAARHRLPTVYSFRYFVTSAALSLTGRIQSTPSGVRPAT